MTDHDYVENERQFSPDNTMMLINYSIDLGAFGYGKAGTAVLKLADTTKNLRDYTLPNTLSRVKWIDNDTVSAQFDILPSIRSGEKVELNDVEVNGIKVKVSPWDFIGKGEQRKIEHREVSPNGDFELVAYRYVKEGSDLGFIHMSVISVGEKIPKYGNYFLADMQADYVLYATWSADNEVMLYSNSQYSGLIQYYLVEDRIKINHNIIVDDKKFGNRYRWGL